MSATDSTATEEPTVAQEEVVVDAAPTREGEIIAVVDTFGVTLEDPSALRTQVRDRSSPQPKI